jgi:preprotein translocase subunit SecA
MRIFAADRISGIMQRLGMEEGVPIESKLVSRQIEGAQKKVEGQNFSSRKHVLEYDDVMNKQRETVYGLRRQLLDSEDQKEFMMDKAADIMAELVAQYAHEDTRPEDWEIDALQKAVLTQFGFDFIKEGVDYGALGSQQLEEALIAKMEEKYGRQEALIGPSIRYHERMIMLQIVDAQWKDHLLAMDHLKEGIGLRGYGQRDPLVEYKKESYVLFEDLMNRIFEDTIRFLFLMAPVEEQKQAEELERRRKRQQAFLDNFATAGDESANRQAKRDAAKVGRNDPCPCGSGKKYKKCHGGA